MTRLSGTQESAPPLKTVGPGASVCHGVGSAGSICPSSFAVIKAASPPSVEEQLGEEGYLGRSTLTSAQRTQKVFSQILYSLSLSPAAFPNFVSV